MFIESNLLKKIPKLLKLDKPLVIFDIETTGISISADKIVDLAYIKLWPDGRIKKEDILLNPEIKISLEAMAVHGIGNKEVKGKPKFRDRANEIWDLFQDCYYCGFNVMNFDLPILRREFIRIGMDFDYNNKQIIDTREIFLKMVPRTLSTAYEYYCKKNKKAHNAMGDAEIASEILVKQLTTYKEIRNWEFINKIHQFNEDDYLDNTRKFYWLKGQAYFAFSKYIDKRLDTVANKDPGFLEWIVKSDFTKETKDIVKRALTERKKEGLIDKLKFRK